MEQTRVQGLVIASSPIGEYDKRVVILTKEMGKISAFARGARRANSSLLAAAMPFSWGEFMIIEGKSSNSIASASISDHFTGVREDLNKVYIGMYLLELADYFTREYNDEREMLKLLYMSLKALESGKYPLKLVKAVFEWKSLVINGTYPDINSDSFRKRYSLGKSAIYAVSYVTASPVEKLFTFALNDETLKEMSEAVSREIEKVLDKKINSLEIIEALGII